MVDLSNKKRRWINANRQKKACLCHDGSRIMNHKITGWEETITHAFEGIGRQKCHVNIENNHLIPTAGTFERVISERGKNSQTPLV